MRLWHKDLIEVLPRQQLLAQWRELCSIYAKEDKHILINFIYDYSPSHLYTYSQLIMNEMIKRNYKISDQALNRNTNYFKNKKVRKIRYDQLFKDKMNDHYLRQCYYNLEEKFDCYSITQGDWEKIKEKLKHLY
ncbi:pyrimidine dimer DNA glycosylase/endonuclease V [Anaerorhabdus sp.]|uniref:pyrimidine dimer DNA glycosylase/endonuclease V n=1 Tax=Anaerorhabdus sp. TaxID=1872524 RepID=UPI002FC8CA44